MLRNRISTVKNLKRNNKLGHKKYRTYKVALSINETVILTMKMIGSAIGN